MSKRILEEAMRAKKVVNTGAAKAEPQGKLKSKAATPSRKSVALDKIAKPVVKGKQAKKK